MATGGDSGIADIDADDDSEEEIDEAVVKIRNRGPWIFLPGDSVASSNSPSALLSSSIGFFRDESTKPWVVRLEARQVESAFERLWRRCSEVNRNAKPRIFERKNLFAISNKR